MTLLCDNRLAACRRIFFRDLAIEASIGFHPFELENRQRVLVNVDVFVPVSASTSADDHVGDVLDYDHLRDAIRAWVQSRHFNLQETLIDGIAEVCLDHPPVVAVRVSTEKPDVYPDCRSVGVEVLRFKDAA